MVNCCGFLNEHPYINMLFVGLGLYTLDKIEYRPGVCLRANSKYAGGGCHTLGKKIKI